MTIIPIMAVIVLIYMAAALAAGVLIGWHYAGRKFDACLRSEQSCWYQKGKERGGLEARGLR